MPPTHPSVAGRGVGIAPPVDGEVPVAAAAAREEVRRKLLALYEKHRPDQAKFVDTLMKQCPAGKEAALLAKVEQKFAQSPQPPAKRARGDPRQKANVYVVGDRVMVPLRRGAGPEEAAWVPGEVVEAADPGGTLPSGGKYAVTSHEDCEPPNQRRRLIVFDDAKASVRPEVCFSTFGGISKQAGRKMVQHATVMPRPWDIAKGPREGQAWRFKVGDKVACRVDKEGDGTGDLEWATGTVATVGGRESGCRTDTVAAYKVNLDPVDRYTANPYASEEDLSWRQKLGGVKPRAVFAAHDEHWLIRPYLQQAPGRIAAPSSVALRYVVRPVRDERGEITPGKWERYDHATAHSEPAEKPPADFAGAAAAAAAAPEPPKYSYIKKLEADEKGPMPRAYAAAFQSAGTSTLGLTPSGDSKA